MHAWKRAFHPGRWLGLPAALVLSACAQPEIRVPETPRPGEATLKVMTYNVNYGIAGDEDTLAAVEGQSADLVLLQETTPEWESHLRARFGARYPHISFRHCCGAGGLGFLSRFPFDDEEYIEPPERGWFPAWRVTVRSPLGSVQVLNVHLRPQIGDGGGIVSGYFSTPPVRRAEIEKYFAHLSDDTPTIIAGDFNEGSSGGALEYLAERGFRSVVGEYGARHTWRWNTSLGTVQREFDHIVYGPGIRPLRAQVIDEGRSDHLPVVGVFRAVAVEAERRPEPSSLSSIR